MERISSKIILVMNQKNTKNLDLAGDDLNNQNENKNQSEIVIDDQLLSESDSD